MLQLLGHVLVAIGLQLIVAWPTRSLTAGAFAASAWAVAREITQAEYRWIEHYGSGLRANMPWWGGFDPIVWQKLDPWLDWAVPTMVVFTIAVIARQAAKSKA